MSGICDPKDVACQLARIADSSGAWDWNSFASTLLATSLGGLFVLASAWLGFVLQRKHREREVLDDSIVRVLEQITVYITAARMGAGAAPVGNGASGSEAFALLTALDIARMRAGSKERAILSESIVIVRRVNKIPAPGLRIPFIGGLGGVLSRWRSGVLNPQRTMAELAKIKAIAEPLDVVVDTPGDRS